MHPPLPAFLSRAALPSRAVPGLWVIDALHTIEAKTGGFPELACAFSRFIDTHQVISAGLAEWMQARTGVPREKFWLTYLSDMSGDPDSGAAIRALC